MEGGILMAGAVDRICCASSSLAWLLPSVVRRVKGCRAGAHGDGCGACDEDARGAIMRCRSRTGSAVPVRTARWRA